MRERSRSDSDSFKLKAARRPTCCPHPIRRLASGALRTVFLWSCCSIALMWRWGWRPSLFTPANARALHCRPRPHQLAFLVHTPKTGGTALVDFVEAGHCDELGLCAGDSHGARLSTLQRAARRAGGNGPRPVAVVREPVERFLSTFLYWKYGSPNSRWPARSEAFVREWDVLFPDAASFVDAWSEPGHRLHGAAWRVLSGQAEESSLHPLTWEEHWLPQRHWLDGDVSQATLVCFTGDADAFAGRIQRALAPWVPCDLSAINRTNASPHDERAARSRRLGETHRAWLRHEYRADLRLWNRTCL